MSRRVSPTERPPVSAAEYLVTGGGTCADSRSATRWCRRGSPLRSASSRYTLSASAAMALLQQHLGHGLGDHGFRLRRPIGADGLCGRCRTPARREPAVAPASPGGALVHEAARQARAPGPASAPSGRHRRADVGSGDAVAAERRLGELGQDRLPGWPTPPARAPHPAAAPCPPPPPAPARSRASEESSPPATAGSGFGLGLGAPAPRPELTAAAAARLRRRRIRRPAEELLRGVGHLELAASRARSTISSLVSTRNSSASGSASSVSCPTMPAIGSTVSSPSSDSGRSRPMGRSISSSGAGSSSSSMSGVASAAVEASGSASAPGSIDESARRPPRHPGPRPRPRSTAAPPRAGRAGPAPRRCSGPATAGC